MSASICHTLSSFAHREVVAPVGLWERGAEASGIILPSVRLFPAFSPLLTVRFSLNLFALLKRLLLRRQAKPILASVSLFPVALDGILLGNAHKDLGHLPIAEECCRKAIELRPDVADVHYNLANILRDQGRLDDSVDSYRQALELNPGFTDARKSMGKVLMKCGHCREGLENLRMSYGVIEFSNQDGDWLRT